MVSNTTFQILFEDKVTVDVLVKWLTELGLTEDSSSVGVKAGNSVWVNERYDYGDTYINTYRFAMMVGRTEKLNNVPGGHTETYTWPLQHKAIKEALIVAFDPLYHAELIIKKEVGL